MTQNDRPLNACSTCGARAHYMENRVLFCSVHWWEKESKRLYPPTGDDEK